MSPAPKFLPSEAEPLISIVRDGPLFIMSMNDNENRFTVEFCKAICDGLDYIAEVVDKEGLQEAAVVTRGQDKFYSNGLHFEKALAVPGFTEDHFMPMLNKILLFSLPTIACINGYVLFVELLKWPSFCAPIGSIKFLKFIRACRTKGSIFFLVDENWRHCCHGGILFLWISLYKPYVGESSVGCPTQINTH